MWLLTPSPRMVFSFPQNNNRRSTQWNSSTAQSTYCKPSSPPSAQALPYGAQSICSKATATTTPARKVRVSSSSWRAAASRWSGWCWCRSSPASSAERMTRHGHHHPEDHRVAQNAAHQGNHRPTHRHV